MENWVTSFTEKLLELPAATWFVLGIMAILGTILIIMMVKKAPRPALITVSILLVIALAAASAMTIPVISADLESGGTTVGSWLYSPSFWALLLSALGLVVLVLLLRKTRWTVKMISAAALCIALSFILDCITLYRLPQGGGINPAAMLPIMFFAWSFGVIPGITAGIVHGLLGMIAGAYVIHPLQFLLDYIFPFAMLGLAGIFKGQRGFIYGILLAGFMRFVMHFLSGYVYFGSYAPEGQSPFLYSLIYNGSYMLPNTVICIAVYLIPPVGRMLEKLRRGWSLET